MFNISERAHRIHNPITSEKFTALGGLGEQRLAGWHSQPPSGDR